MSYSEGDKVKWNWGNGTGTGKITKVYHQKITRTSTMLKVTFSASAGLKTYAMVAAPNESTVGYQTRICIHWHQTATTAARRPNAASPQP